MKVQNKPLALEHRITPFLCLCVAIVVGHGVGEHRLQPDVAQFHMDAPVCTPHMVAADHVVKPEREGHIDALDQAAVDVSVLLILQFLKHLGEHRRDHRPAQIVPHFPPGAVLGRNADPQNQPAGEHGHQPQNDEHALLSHQPLAQHSRAAAGHHKDYACLTVPSGLLEPLLQILFHLICRGHPVFIMQSTFLPFCCAFRCLPPGCSPIASAGLPSFYCLYKVSTASRASMSSVT